MTDRTAVATLVTQFVVFFLNVTVLDIPVNVIHQHDGVTTFMCQGLFISSASLQLSCVAGFFPTDEATNRYIHT